METGAKLYEFLTSLNGGANIDVDAATILIDNAKTILEEERPWEVLRKIDRSKSVSTDNTWQTEIDLSTIEDFSRFYANDDGIIIKLFDGYDRVEYYYLKTFDQRLEYKNVSNTCVYDENSKKLYLNGSVPFAGTLWIPYVSTTEEIDLTSEDPIWTVFPKRFLPLLAYYAVGIFKGAIDYDSINKMMLPGNRDTLLMLKNAMEKWDNEKQLASIQSNDPSEVAGGYPRSGAIDRDNY